MRRVSLLVVFTLGLVCFLEASSGPAAPFLKNDPDAIRWQSAQSGQVHPGGKKDCSAVYPVPEAAKHWTGCQSGEYSQCGGPADCACTDDDDRLTWYHCKEGSYAVCEDDNTCKEGS